MDITKYFKNLLNSKNMEKSWIKLHRKLLKSDVFKAGNEKLLRVFMHLLLKAEYSSKEVVIYNRTVRLSAGQFLFDKKTCAEELGINANTLYYQVRKLESMGMISIHSNNRYTLIRIKNWSKYQSNVSRRGVFKKKNITGKVLDLKIE